MISELWIVLKRSSTYFLSKLGSYDGRLVSVLALFIPFILTYLITLTQYRRSLIYKGGPAKPPRLPYIVPGLGSAIEFNRDAVGFINSAMYAAFLPHVHFDIAELQ